MDASTCPWVTADDTALWDLAPVPCAVTTFGTGSPDFSSSVNYPMGGVANTPSFFTMAPAPQGVIALNLSFVDSTGNPSAGDLDSLLAGLLDNSTGGVNGTFRDETGNLSSLELAAPVMSALANGVWDSGGIFGAPVSEATPPPPPCTGVCSVWNTVSGVVTMIVAGIVSFVGVVWDAVTAATAFLDDAVQGLASLAETAANAAVGALEAVGAQLLKAVGVFVQFLIAQAKAFFGPVLTLVMSALKAFTDSISADFGSLLSSICSALGTGGPVSADSSASDLMGAGSSGSSVSTAMQVIGTILQPVSTIMDPLTLGGDLMSLLGLGSVFSSFNSGISKVIGGSSNVVGAVLSGFFHVVGFDQAAPSTLPDYSLIQCLVSTPDAVPNLLQSLFDPPILVQFFTGIWETMVSSSVNFEDFALTVLALLTFILSSILVKTSSTVDKIINYLGWGLTFLGFAEFEQQSPFFDELSIGTDLASFILDLLELFKGFLGGKPSAEWILIADGVDSVADWFDIFASGCDLGVKIPVICP